MGERGGRGEKRRWGRKERGGTGREEKSGGSGEEKWIIKALQALHVTPPLCLFFVVAHVLA